MLDILGLDILSLDILGTTSPHFRLKVVYKNKTHIIVNVWYFLLFMYYPNCQANHYCLCLLTKHSFYSYTAPPAPPGTPSVLFPTQEMVFTLTWTDPPLNMDETIDAYFVNISGPNDLCGTGNTLQNVTERNYNCSIQATPREGDRYTITVAAANCDGNLRGPESPPAILQGTL